MSARPYVSFAEVKQKVSIPEVLELFELAEGFTLRGATLTGVCPLPSHHHGPQPNPEQFKINEKGGVWVWHCFGDCQRGGDVIELVKALTGYDDAHVRFWIAEQFGDRLSTGKPKQRTQKLPDPDDNAKEEAREVRQTPPRAKQKSTNDSLPTSPPSLKPLRFHLNLDPAVPYLYERGLTTETIAKFDLGLCRKGVLNGYVAIPIYGYPHPPDANPAAYLGRWPGEDFDADEGRPRYKWPIGFEKSQVVFALREALESSSDDDPLIVVEGCFSVFHLVQAGFTSAVATFGSSLSDEQASILLQTSRPIVFMYDGNEAGRMGMRKGAGKLITGTFVRIVRLPDKLQPDELSAEELHQLLDF